VRSPARLLSVLAVGLITSITANAEEAPVLNEDIEASHAERMNYPLYARLHAVEGAVVVRAELEKDGSVRAATAISGPRDLTADSVSNAMKWIFGRTGHGVAVIVYIFRIAGACELPCPSNWEFHPPNVVVVTIGRPLVTP